MLSGELIKKIRYIEIKSKKLVEGSFSGEYRSGLRGKGMEFDSIRQYYPGDDVRNIDWNVTARQNKAYVKQFCEEREMNIYLLIDMSLSNSFGDKKRIIAELGATLALSASMNNDKVGAVFFAERVEKFIPSKNGRKHVLSIIENILDFRPVTRGTDIAEALNYFHHIEKKRSTVFLISDFLDDGYMDDIKIISKFHDMVLIRVIDRAEEQIPAGAVFSFEDLETGERYDLNNLRGSYRSEVKSTLTGSNFINIYTDEDYIKPLRLFFKRRARL